MLRYNNVIRCLTLGTFLLISFIILAPLKCEAQELPDSKNKVLTLKDAIEIALKNQPQIEAQQNQVEVERAKAGQAKGGYYPHITLSSAYSKIGPVESRTSATTSLAGLPPGGNIPSGISEDTKPYSQYSAVGSLNQLLFDFGKTAAQVRSQKSATDAASSSLEDVREQIIYSVKEAYFNLLNAERNRDAAAEAVKQYEDHLEYARGLFEAGAKPKFDVTKAEVDLSNAKVNLIKAENGVKFYRMSLNNAIGMPDMPFYEVEEPPSSDKIELIFEEAVQAAYQKRPDLISLQKQKVSAQETVKAIKRGHYPTLNGVASYTYVGTEFPLDHGWIAGVNLVFPLFSGFTTTYQVEEAQARLAVIIANERILKQKIKLELEQAYLALRESDERVRSTEVAVRQARENFELATERYSAGLAIAVEISDAVAAYANARIAYSSAYYDHKIAQAQIVKAVGGE